MQQIANFIVDHDPMMAIRRTHDTVRYIRWVWNKDHLELKCRVYATTRGKHFLFKNCGVKKSWTKCTLAVGITTDGKVGANNSYEILKSGGVERPILYDFPEGEIQELPKWLTPVKSNYDFPNLGEGDGRNQTLFNYILTLQSDDFTKEEARE